MLAETDNKPIQCRPPPDLDFREVLKLEFTFIDWIKYQKAD